MNANVETMSQITKIEQAGSKSVDEPPDLDIQLFLNRQLTDDIRESLGIPREQPDTGKEQHEP